MTPQLRDEIKQKQPFDSPQQAAYLSVQRTASLLGRGLSKVLRRSGLTPTQYNVLRILRGADRPLTCSEVGERMIALDPDVTRLLDRLEEKGLIQRERSTEDRRVVVSEITGEGREIVDDLDDPVARLHEKQLGHMGEEKLRTLAALLEEAREGAPRAGRGQGSR